MATETSGSVNGFSAGPPASTSAAGQNQEQEVSKEQIGWYFVERYYNTLSKNPANLYLLYSKRSQFVVGVEEEKVQVSIGLKSINERVKELNYQNCKVRVNNVDSQSSDVNIVVQVLGEMSNDSQPHRKFVQTFVLAPQPQGYFLLNDILRFLIEEDEPSFEAQDEAQPADVETARSAVEDEAKVDANTAPVSTEEVVATPEAAVKVDEKLEEVAKTDEAKPVNGTTPVAEADAEPEVVPAEPSVAGAEEVEAKSEQAAEELPVEEEKPVDPAPTPAEPKSTPKAAPSQNKPAVPLSWAQRAAASAAAAAAPRTPAPASSQASAATNTTTPAQQKAAPTTPSTSSSNNTSTQAAPSVNPTSVPARQASPSDSNQEGSSGGWQTAGGDHSRNKSRSQPGPSVADNGHVRAYVKNVYQSVNADDLKAELSKYGELAYFDISRQKNSAFVEFKSLVAFQAAVQNNPHKIGGDNIYVEERRPAASYPRGGLRDGARGGLRGGARGGFNPGKSEGGSSRGGFSGNRGRGGPGLTANRGRPQPV